MLCHSFGGLFVDSVCRKGKFQLIHVSSEGRIQLGHFLYFIFLYIAPEGP